MIRYFRYVPIDQDIIEKYAQLGWMLGKALGPPHGHYSVLMQWPCSCKCVEPVNVPA